MHGTVRVFPPVSTVSNRARKYAATIMSLTVAPIALPRAFVFRKSAAGYFLRISRGRRVSSSSPKGKVILFSTVETFLYRESACFLSSSLILEYTWSALLVPVLISTSASPVARYFVYDSATFILKYLRSEPSKHIWLHITAQTSSSAPRISAARNCTFPKGETSRVMNLSSEPVTSSVSA